MEMTEGTSRSTDDDIENNGEKWKEMDELDVADGGVSDEDGEESQLPDDLANCFNVTIQTTRYGRITAVPSKLKTRNIDNVYAQQLYYKTVTY